MDELRQRLAFLTDWLPDGVREWAPVEVWWLAYLVVVLAALLLVGLFFKALYRALFRRRAKLGDWEPELREDVTALPLANVEPIASVYHLPARLRLVVLAPAGKGTTIHPDDVFAILDSVVPGLAALVKHDGPRVVLWPPPLRPAGFASSFHRATPTGEPADRPSRWVFLAGRCQGGGRTAFIGLALWTDEPSSLGRREVAPEQWLDVLRLGARSRA